MADYKDYGFHNAEPSHAIAYLEGPLLSLLNKETNRCILDLGCGNGYLVNYLLSLGFNVYGTDASEKGIAIATQTQPGRFFLQDLSSDELPDQLRQFKFDTVISTEVVEHLYNPQAFADFCKRTLAPNGQIIISTPYHGYLKNLVLALFNKWDSHANPLWLGGHIKLWSRATLSKLLTDTGFTVTDFKGCGRIPYFWKSMIIKARLD